MEQRTLPPRYDGETTMLAPHLQGGADAEPKASGATSGSESSVSKDAGLAAATTGGERDNEAASSDGKAASRPSVERIELQRFEGIDAEEDGALHDDEQQPRKPTGRRRTISDVANRARRSVPPFLQRSSGLRLYIDRITAWCLKHLNFYRIHLLVFTFTPLIAAAIFYASNTQPIPFIDCLFVCVSAMTVTGLATFNVSTATAWQQAIMYFLMTIGNITAVSVTMIWIRRHFFRVKFDSIIQRSAKARQRMNDVEYAHQKEKRKELIRLQRLIGLRKRRKHKNGEQGDEDGDDANELEMTPHDTASTDEIAEAELQAERAARKKERQRKKKPLRADMIRRMDQPAVLINPMGAVSHAIEDRAEPNTPGQGGILNFGQAVQNDDHQSGSGDTPNIRIAEPTFASSHRRRISDTSDAEKLGRPSGSPERMSREEEENLHRSVSASRLTGSRRRSLLVFRDQTPLRQSEEGRGGDDAVLSPPPFEGPRSADAAQVRTRFQDDDDDDDDDADAGPTHRARHGSDPPITSRHARRGSDSTPYQSAPARSEMFPRAQTIEFADPPRGGTFGRSNAYAHSTAVDSSMRHRTQTTNDFERTPTMRSGYGMRRVGTNVPMSRTQTTSMERGFGGFPTPFELASVAIKRTLPHVQERFKRTTTMPRTATFASTHSAGGATFDGRSVKPAPYLTFDATVSRNSRFHQLTEAQRDELGGVEYRAIDMLAKLIPLYYFSINFFCITLVAPWLAKRSASINANAVIDSQAPYSPNTTWFWFFQVISAYSNTGLSLIDTSMTLLNDQYLMLIPIAFLILAGNTAFPIFLRFFIWLLSLVMPKNSRTYETLRFLLDHPRRCFVYLFPSAQTWFLFGILVFLNCFDWIMFQVLDLGNRTIESWSVGQRIFDGLFQSIAVRAAGFQIISLLELAPAVQFLYIIMMYISAYPVAMSVRNTNVYEERSLGIFNDAGPGQEADEPQQGGPKVWGTYLAAHARRQLAFDMWWLGFALWLVCIIERENIQDPTTDGWFTVFSCLFELTSAYGTVGLSTGTPVDAFSLSGRFHTLSKLVVIAVMLRGRHRGLPVAIDRAVLLPDDLEIEDDAQAAAYTIDEDGMIRTRSSYLPEPDLRQGDDDDDDEDEEEYDGSGAYDKRRRMTNVATASTSAYFPRTPTNASATRTPGGGVVTMRRMSRERSMPVMDLDAYAEGKEEAVAGEERDDVDAIKTEKRDEAVLDDNDARAMFGYLSSHHPLTSIREGGSTPLPPPSPQEKTPKVSDDDDSPASSEKGKAKEKEYAMQYGSSDPTDKAR